MDQTSTFFGLKPFQNTGLLFCCVPLDTKIVEYLNAETDDLFKDNVEAWVMENWGQSVEKPRGSVPGRP